MAARAATVASPAVTNRTPSATGMATPLSDERRLENFTLTLLGGVEGPAHGGQGPAKRVVARRGNCNAWRRCLNECM